MKILFSGGGTLGSVTPLLAIAEMVRKKYPETVCAWIGTKNGPETALVRSYGIVFFSVSSGKLRRYASWGNALDMARVAVGFFQSIILLRRIRPTVCLSAGGFVSVPVHAAAWVLGIPTWIHQQDVDVGLANKIMSKFAAVITTALAKSAKEDFDNATWIGNPVRGEALEGNLDDARQHFGFQENLPVVLVTGGGIGSFRLNQLIVEALPKIHEFCRIIHVTGGERGRGVVERATEIFPNYRTFDFLYHDLKDAYALADVVVARGGFGTLSELAALKKSVILIPKGGHQTDNAKFFEENGAVRVVNELTGDGNVLAKEILDLLSDAQRRQTMGDALSKLLPKAKSEETLEILEKIIITV